MSSSGEAAELGLLAGDLEAEAFFSETTSADDEASPVTQSRRKAKLGLACVLVGLVLAVLVRDGAEARGVHENRQSPSLLHHVANLVAVQLHERTKCTDHLDKDDPCYFSVHWAKTQGIFDHPEWYEGLTPDSSAKDFQATLYQQGATNCSHAKPCDFEKVQDELEAKADKAKKQAAKDAAAAAKVPAGPRAQTFYMYRAQSKASYPLENINSADLAGVFWYLHNEVIVATPRKYKIDRIKRYKVTVKNTWEFWNTHKRQFGAFVAYDAGGCTTPVCKDIYHQYGFIVGCQVQPLSVAGYLGRHQTNWQCKEGEDECRAPIWYSLPGPCPAKGIPNDDIDPNAVDLDVERYKTAECVERMPGGHCDAANGDPDCTYSYEEAGEIFLDDLVGIEDYNEFWNTSYTECMKDVHNGILPEDTFCRHNKEYDAEEDVGVGTDFWDGKHDTENCTRRMDAARKLFKKNFPEFPEHLEEPPCEFDMYYDGEFDWKINHTGAATSSWWDDRM